MSKEIETLLRQAVEAAKIERKGRRMSREEREQRRAAMIEWARFEVAVRGGRYVDYANPFENQMAEAWKV